MSLERCFEFYCFNLCNDLRAVISLLRSAAKALLCYCCYTKSVRVFKSGVKISQRDVVMVLRKVGSASDLTGSVATTDGAATGAVATEPDRLPITTIALESSSPSLSSTSVVLLSDDVVFNTASDPDPIGVLSFFDNHCCSGENKIESGVGGLCVLVA